MNFLKPYGVVLCLALLMGCSDQKKDTDDGFELEDRFTVFKNGRYAVTTELIHSDCDPLLQRL